MSLECNSRNKWCCLILFKSSAPCATSKVSLKKQNKILYSTDTNKANLHACYNLMSYVSSSTKPIRFKFDLVHWFKQNMESPTFKCDHIIF